MKVWVNKPKCTGCSHCFDVCPVAVFTMTPKDSPDVNKDVAPPEQQYKGVEDQAIHDKFANQTCHTHYKEKSVAVNGEACILCQACLIECEGECIHIVDENGQQYDSIYK